MKQFTLVVSFFLFTCVSAQEGCQENTVADCRSLCRGKPCRATEIPGQCYKYCFCGKFWQVAHFELSCNDGKVFHPDRQLCVSQEEYTCPIPFNCTGKDNGNYPYPGNCSSFIMCSNGYPSVQPCPNNLHFCSKCAEPRCEYPDTANCTHITCKEGVHYSNEKDYPTPQYDLPEKTNRVAKGALGKLAAAATTDEADEATAESSAQYLNKRTKVKCAMPDGVYWLLKKQNLRVACEGGMARMLRSPKQGFKKFLNILSDDEDDAKCAAFYYSHLEF